MCDVMLQNFTSNIFVKRNLMISNFALSSKKRTVKKIIWSYFLIPHVNDYCTSYINWFLVAALYCKHQKLCESCILGWGNYVVALSESSILGHP